MESIAGNRNLSVGSEKDGKKAGDQRELVFKDKHLKVKRHQVENVGGDMQWLIGGGDEGAGNLDVAIKGDHKETITGADHRHVKKDRKEKVDGGQSLTVGGDQQEKVGKNHLLEAGQVVHVKAGMTMILEAGMQLSLKVGGNFIDISPAGVTIVGTMVMINSGGAAGSAPDASPVAPEDAKEASPTQPDEADDSKSGLKSAPG